MRLAQTAKQRPADIRGGGFTISKLGIYDVDTLNANVTSRRRLSVPSAASQTRLVAVNGRLVVQPTLLLTLSCDQR